MGKKSDQNNNSSAADPWKSKAVQKLYNVVQKVFDLSTPDDRLIAAAKAKAEVKKIEAQSQAEAEAIKLLSKAETAAKAKIVEARGDLAARALNRMEGDAIRQQQNIEAIITEAYVALPPPDQRISDEPVNEDFIHRFFDDSKNISDEQMRTVWGRLLAGEIAQPGSYHPKTLAVLKDLTKYDAELFVSVCRFAVRFEMLVPLIFNHMDDVYRNADVNFGALLHLDDLGLINFQSLVGFTILKSSVFTYGTQEFVVMTPSPDSIPVGQVAFSSCGSQLAQLVDAAIVPEFVNYFTSEWHNRGVVATPKDSHLALLIAR